MTWTPVYTFDAEGRIGTLGDSWAITPEDLEKMKRQRQEAAVLIGELMARNRIRIEKAKEANRAV